MGDVIDFERAEFAPDGSRVAAAPCTRCKRPMRDQYWKLGNSPVCGSCRDAIAAAAGRGTSNAALGKAALQGGVVAVLCGIGYGGFVAVTHVQLALITIGIAYVVAKTVRKASGGMGGPRFQVLAVAMTYLASTMGYLAPLLRADLGGRPLETLGVALAAPFLELRQSPLGLVIVGIGLWEAWKLTRGAPIVFHGPFRMGALATETEGAAEGLSSP